jgi:hypothetical protein
MSIDTKSRLHNTRLSAMLSYGNENLILYQKETRKLGVA